MSIIMLRNFVTKNSLSGKVAFPIMNNRTAHAQVENTTTKAQRQKLIKTLRNETGYPIVKCKQALDKCDYNLEQSTIYINEEATKEGWKKMASLKNRVAKEGLVTVIGDKKSATMIEVNCETDFVGKTESFHYLVFQAAKAIHHNFAGDIKIIKDLKEDEILTLSNEENVSVKTLLAQTVSKLKENIVISRARVLTLDKKNNEYLGIYVHPSTASPLKGNGKGLPTMGKYAAITTVESEDKVGKLMLRDISQHIVGMRPKHVGEYPAKSSEQIDEEEIPDINNQIEDEGKQEDKPELKDQNIEDMDEDEILDEGSFSYMTLSETLIEQPFLLNTELTVLQWCQLNNIKVINFERFELGENK